MRPFRLLINYLVLMTIPFWGPFVCIFHNKKLEAWTSFEALGERIKELSVCLVAPFAMMLFMAIIRFIKIDGFNSKLEDNDKIETDTLQNMYEAFRYGNHWVWETFPDSYRIEQDRKQMMKDCLISLDKMSIITNGRSLIPKKKER